MQVRSRTTEEYGSKWSGKGVSGDAPADGLQAELQSTVACRLLHQAAATAPGKLSVTVQPVGSGAQRVPRRSWYRRMLSRTKSRILACTGVGGSGGQTQGWVPRCGRLDRSHTVVAVGATPGRQAGCLCNGHECRRRAGPRAPRLPTDPRTPRPSTGPGPPPHPARHFCTDTHTHTHTWSLPRSMGLKRPAACRSS